MKQPAIEEALQRLTAARKATVGGYLYPADWRPILRSVARHHDVDAGALLQVMRRAPALHLMRTEEPA